MKKGFSLIVAVIFLVTVATLGALALSISTQSVKKTTDNFLYHQAELLVDSGVTYTLLAMSGHDYSTNCLDQVNMTYNKMFDINVSINYIGSGIGSCTNVLTPTDINTSESNRTVILDTTVTLNDNIATEKITVHRRSIQKP